MLVAHPGHELRVFHWISRVRPRVHILTDGSGPDRGSRVSSTLALLEQAGAVPGSICGRYRDRELYELMEAGDPAPFVALAEELVTDITDGGFDVVAGDMAEGFNTGHDIARVLIDCAVERASRIGGREIANLEFPLERIFPPDEFPPGAEVLELDDEAFAVKRHAATECYPELAGEIERLSSRYGEKPFRLEWLQPSAGRGGLEWSGDGRPFYEEYGAKQVTAGHYETVITFERHLRPLAEALHAWARQGAGAGVA